jgi:transposase InsO family protein
VGRKRVARLMRRAGLLAKAKRRFKLKTHAADKYFVEHRRPNAQSITHPNQLWVGDITYIRSGSHHVYLAAVMDLFNRQIVGWHLSSQRSGQLTAVALSRAIEARRPPRGVVFHSDQGIEYASYVLRATLTNHGFVQSMSRRGNCYDNAHMESFFHSLKTECLNHFRFSRIEEIQARVFQYIEAFYNTRRAHSSLGYLSPMAYLERS